MAEQVDAKVSKTFARWGVWVRVPLPALNYGQGKGRMRADIATRLKRARIALVTTLLGWFMRVLGATWRIHVVEGREQLDALHTGSSPAILAFWHDQVLLGAYYTGMRMARKRGVDVTALTSRSGDGELVARVMRNWGARIVRGSSSAGGREAMWELRTVVRRHRSSPIMVPDGPRGPARHLKRGILVLARVSGAPVLAMGFAADRRWRLNSWDRLIIPRPFARVRVCVRRFEIDRRDDRDADRDDQHRLQSMLNEVTHRAEAAEARDAGR